MSERERERERESVCKKTVRERERERFANLIRSVLGGSFDCVTEVPLRLREGGFGSDVSVCEYVCVIVVGGGNWETHDRLLKLGLGFAWVWCFLYSHSKDLNRILNVEDLRAKEIILLYNFDFYPPLIF